MPNMGCIGCSPKSRNLKDSHCKVCSLLLLPYSKTLSYSWNKFLYHIWRSYRLSMWIPHTALLWIGTCLSAALHMCNSKTSRSNHYPLCSLINISAPTYSFPRCFFKKKDIECSFMMLILVLNTAKYQSWFGHHNYNYVKNTYYPIYFPPFHRLQLLTLKDAQDI